MPTAFPVTVFLHHGEPEKELEHESHVLDCASERQAQVITRAFFSGKVFSVLGWLPGLKRRMKEVEIDAGLAVSGAVSVHEESLRNYAPDLL